MAPHPRTSVSSEGKVPDPEIDRAIEYKSKFAADPEKHTFRI
jgi:hypothetical protein